MLPTTNRLKQNDDFKRVYSRGSSCAIGPVVVYSLKTDSGIRVGFSVSKKLGNAIKRNRVRRLLREAVRMMLADLQEGNDIVVVARRSASESLLPDFCNALQGAFRRKGLLNG